MRADGAAVWIPELEFWDKSEREGRWGCIPVIDRFAAIS